MAKPRKRGAKVADLMPLLHPGQGWPQQGQFVRIIGKIDDESDRHVKFLRALRMCVGLRGVGIDERTWERLLLVSETLVDFERELASRIAREERMPEALGS